MTFDEELISMGFLWVDQNVRSELTLRSIKICFHQNVYICIVFNLI